jgi:hypothetical protein
MSNPYKTPKSDPAKMPSVVKPAPSSPPNVPASPYNQNQSDGWRTETPLPRE